MFIIGLTGPSGAGKTTALRVLEEMGGQVFDCDAVYHEMLASDGELLAEIEAAFPGSVQYGALDRKALGARVFADPAGLRRLTEITQPLVAKRVLEEIRKSELAASGSCDPSTGLEAGPPPLQAGEVLDAPARHFARSEGSVPPSPGPACAADTPPHPSSGFRETPDATFPSRGRLYVIDAIGLFESGLGAECGLTVAVVADEETRVRRLMERDGVTEAYARARIAAQKPAEWFAERADLVLENNGSEAEFAEKCREEFCKHLPTQP